MMEVGNTYNFYFAVEVEKNVRMNINCEAKLECWDLVNNVLTLNVIKRMAVNRSVIIGTYLIAYENIIEAKPVGPACL